MKHFALVSLCVSAAWILSATTVSSAELRVMSFNLWVGGESGKQPLEQTAQVIRAARADIVGLQETLGNKRDGVRPDNGAKVAALLGWHYFAQGGGPAVASRHPILANSPGRAGVTIRLPSGREVRMFNVHLAHAPYQPYQLAGIPYANGRFIKTAGEAVDEARKARGAQVERLLSELKPALADGTPVFLTGDFNEPSHQDWTPRAAAAGKCPVAVEYPSTLAVTRAGMRDAFRTAHSDEVTRRGWTWTPTTSPDDPKDRHDRIDLVFFAGANVTVKRCEIVGESAQFADIIVQPYPSDHRAVVATVEIP
jgi:endonuclease/exonuclease/phosphatase family metal-dependent hydrolase